MNKCKYQQLTYLRTGNIHQKIYILLSHIDFVCWISIINHISSSSMKLAVDRTTLSLASRVLITLL